MVVIVSVEEGSDLVGEARRLFAHYRDFLETIASTHCFDFPKYLEETSTLPAAYTEAWGELLLALVDGQAAGCIAYRQALGEPASTCEIKRLYVAPAFRRQGIARALVMEAMARARGRGFARAILDTDAVSMPAAHATYLAMGFTEYTPAGVQAESLRFLEREL